MKWLRSFFANAETVKQLEGERDRLLFRCGVLEEQIKVGEAALINTRAELKREIASNRRREDAFKETIVEMATKTPARIPYRDEGFIETALDAPPKVDADFEKQVTERAQEFAQNALISRGLEYTPEDMEVLKSKIRDNPAEYLGN